MIRKIADLLPKTLHPSTLRQMRSTAVCDAAATVFREFFPTHAHRIRIQYFKEGVLYCDAPSSVLAAEIRFQAISLITQIHERLGLKGAVIDRIIVR